MLLNQISQRNDVLNYALKDGLGTKYYSTSFVSFSAVLVHKLQKQPPEVFFEISQRSQENTCARVSFLIKLKAFSEHLQRTATKVSIKFKR